MEKTKKYASLAIRFFALVIDFGLFCLLFFPTTRLIKGRWIMSAQDHRWFNGLFITDPLCILFLFIMLFYFILLEGYWGFTIGKFIVGIRVENLDGEKPGMKSSLIRNLSRMIDGLPAFNIAGIIAIVRSPENARIGDKLAKTRVVNSERRRN